jgi:hypothetical protein
MSDIKRNRWKPGEENRILPAVLLSFKTPVAVLLAITVLYLIIQLGSLLSQGPEPVDVLVPKYNISPYSLMLNSDLELKSFNKTELSDLTAIKQEDLDGINNTGGDYYSLRSLEAGKPIMLSDVKRAPIGLQNRSIVGIRIFSAAAMGGAIEAGESVMLYSSAKDLSALGLNNSVLNVIVLDILPINNSNLTGYNDLVLAIPKNETGALAKMMSEDILIARDIRIKPNSTGMKQKGGIE